jgi:transcriptional regulator with XRE-family HTH domain
VSHGGFYEQGHGVRRDAATVLSLQGLADMFVGVRRAMHLTEGGLARRLAVSESQIRRWEDDRYGSATLDQLLQVADALGVTIDITAHAKRRERT